MDLSLSVCQTRPAPSCDILEASESSLQTTEYMALAEREPAIPTVYDVLKEKEELNPGRYMSSKNPERVKKIKSWFV